MSVSHNGWPVKPSLWSLPQITGSVRAGSVWVVFNWLANQYDKRVESITKGHSWGYAYRLVTNGKSYSNHASGTAIDLNAPKHPYGTKATANFSTAQIATCNTLIKESQDILKWLDGHDPMHWEIRPGVKPAHVDRLATILIQKALGISQTGNRDSNTIQAIKAFQVMNGLADDGLDGPKTWALLNGRPVPAEPSAPAPGPVIPSPGPSVGGVPVFPLAAGQYFGPELPKSNTKSVSGYWNNGKRDAKGNSHLKLWQQRMSDRGWRISADGLYGTQTRDVTRAFQKEKNLYPIDGFIGQNTWDAAWDLPVTGN